MSDTVRRSFEASTWLATSYSAVMVSRAGPGGAGTS